MMLLLVSLLSKELWDSLRVVQGLSEPRSAQHFCMQAARHIPEIAGTLIHLHLQPCH
jgi:hypothetical protein